MCDLPAGKKGFPVCRGGRHPDKPEQIVTAKKAIIDI